MSVYDRNFQSLCRIYRFFPMFDLYITVEFEISISNELFGRLLMSIGDAMFADFRMLLTCWPSTVTFNDATLKGPFSGVPTKTLRIV